MTEYDYSPEDLDQYRLGQDRISQWAGSSQRFPSQSGFAPSAMGGGVPYSSSFSYDDPDYTGTFYDQDRQYRHHRGRSLTQRPLNRTSYGSYPGYQGTQSERFYSDQYNYAQDPTMSFNNVGNVGGISYPLGSQHPSMNYPGSRMYEDSFSRPGMMNPGHISPSRQTFSRSRYPSSNIQVLRSTASPTTRSRSSTASSGNSTSSRSYSSRSKSYSPTYTSRLNSHHVVHANTNSPTVIHPSRDHATVVPINGGSGGYVVVPAVGQRLQVIDRSSKESFISKVLSPSKWGVMRRKY